MIDFYRNHSRPDGRQTVCKACTRSNTQAWFAAHPDAYWRYRQARAPLTEAQRHARDERARRWHQANPERARENRRRWNAQNVSLARDIARKRAATRKARKLRAFVEYVDPLVVLERADGMCGICGGDVDPLAFHVDHVIPLSRGGEHSYWNTQPAHPRCNQRKHAALPE